MILTTAPGVCINFLLTICMRQAFAVPAQIQLMTMLVKLEEVGSARVRWSKGQIMFADPAKWVLLRKLRMIAY